VRPIHHGRSNSGKFADLLQFQVIFVLVKFIKVFYILCSTHSLLEKKSLAVKNIHTYQNHQPWHTTAQDARY
jgi:hypothetical protein